MVDAQTVGVLVTAASVTVAAIYYVMNIRISQRNQELTLKTLEQSAKSQELTLKAQQQNLETRQAQLFSQLFEDLAQIHEAYEAILKKWSWTDYDDFERKYGKEANPKDWNKLDLILGIHEKMGVLIRHGIFDPILLWDLLGSETTLLWEKLEPWIFELRRRQGSKWFEYFEDLYYTLKEYEAKDGESYRKMYLERRGKRESLGLSLAPFYEAAEYKA